jgi:hypothetical protein
VAISLAIVATITAATLLRGVLVAMVVETTTMDSLHRRGNAVAIGIGIEIASSRGCY